MKLPLSVLIAVASGVYGFRSSSEGSAAHRASGNYRQTPLDLERIEAAKAKRRRREYKRQQIIQRQRIRAHQEMRQAA